ncbi:MFS transporter [Flavobacterium anhuiense]|uniref:MFS transporter n=1 Tax=Flavobacterium anhuiense TaxID=459526 RepID=UPI003D9937B5
MRPSYFKQWITAYPVLMRVCLYFILLSGLAPFGIFAMTSTYALSLAGAQPEDMSFALLVTYVGILVTLPVQFRFLRYFETRSYLLLNIIAGILLSAACMSISDMIFFTIIRFFQGIIICNIAGCMLIIIFSILKSEKTQVIGSSVFYGSILSSGALIGLAVSLVVPSYDWNRIYTYFMIYQVLTLILSILIFKAHAGHKRYPLYQIDWIGCILFITAGLTIAYTMIYGPKYYWFEDEGIITSALVSLITISCFVMRLLTAKRPLVNLDVFKNRNFILGLVLLAFYYGVKDSINLIYSYTAVVLRWETNDTLLLAMINVAGLVIAMALTAQLLLKYRHHITYFFLAGFGFMLIYHIIILEILTPDLSFTDLIMPVFFQGAASGSLMVPIIVFTLSSAPSYTGTTGVVVAAYTRFTSTLNSVAGFYTLQLYYNQSHKESLLSGIIAENVMVMERLNSYGQSALNRTIIIQSQLLTIRSVFFFAAESIAAVLILIFLLPSLNKTILHWNKRMFVLPRK